MENQRALYDLLQQCTVKIMRPGGKIAAGTGFFVAPGLLLTCDHVLRHFNNTYFSSSFPLVWQHEEYKDAGSIMSDGCWPAGDLALVQVTGIDNHPVVLFDSQDDTQRGYHIYGFPIDSENGKELAVGREGRRNQNDEIWRIRLSTGDIGGGFSGSPLLNQDTGAICGIVRLRKAARDMGGYAVPIELALHRFSELQMARAQLLKNTRWLELLADQQRSRLTMFVDLLEEMYTHLDEVQQLRTQRICLRLIAYGETPAQDQRRPPQCVAHLLASNDEQHGLNETIHVLAKAGVLKKYEKNSDIAFQLSSAVVHTNWIAEHHQWWMLRDAAQERQKWQEEVSDWRTGRISHLDEKAMQQAQEWQQAYAERLGAVSGLDALLQKSRERQIFIQVGLVALLVAALTVFCVIVYSALAPLIPL